MFWETSSTIAPGNGFSLFSAVHLCWLAAAAVLFIAAGRWYRNASESSRRRLRILVGILLLVDEFLKDASTLATGRFEWAFLPFHLCSINIFVIWAHILRPSDAKSEFLYAICLPGAFAALLFPSWSKLPAFNLMCIHSFSVHILLMLYPILLLCGGYRPHFSRLKPALFPSLAAVCAVYALNKILGTNFMFLNNGGSGNPLAWAESILGNPGYLLALPVLIGLVWLILYMPLLVARKRAAQNG